MDQPHKDAVRIGGIYGLLNALYWNPMRFNVFDVCERLRGLPAPQPVISGSQHLANVALLYGLEEPAGGRAVRHRLITAYPVVQINLEDREAPRNGVGLQFIDLGQNAFFLPLLIGTYAAVEGDRSITGWYARIFVLSHADDYTSCTGQKSTIGESKNKESSETISPSGMEFFFITIDTFFEKTVSRSIGSRNPRKTYRKIKTNELSRYTSGRSRRGIPKPPLHGAKSFLFLELAQAIRAKRGTYRRNKGSINMALASVAHTHGHAKGGEPYGGHGTVLKSMDVWEAATEEERAQLMPLLVERVELKEKERGIVRLTFALADPRSEHSVYSTFDSVLSDRLSINYTYGPLDTTMHNQPLFNPRYTEAELFIPAGGRNIKHVPRPNRAIA